MTPEETAAAAAAAAAQPPPIDYTKLVVDYSKLDYGKLAAAQATIAAEAQRKKDADLATSATATAAEEKRKADEAAALLAGKQKPWNVKEAPEFLKLQADLAAKTAKDEEREKKAEMKERSGTVKSALSDYTFASESAKTSANKLLFDAVKLGEDGESYVGPDGSPADVYIAHMMDTEFDYFLKVKDVGGSGARNGGTRKETVIDLDSIKPGMKPEDRARAYARIAELSPGR
jgi:hypothetical protein